MYYEINEEAAATARQAWSFREYVKGSKTNEYRSKVDKCYKLVESLPDDLKEKGASIADRYAKKLADWYNRQFQIEMMCPSVMISGAGNFPVRKKEKQNAAQDRHYKLYQEIEAMPDKIKRMINGTNIIKSSDSDAIDQLKAKLEVAEKLQAEMKAANAYYRKHKTMKGYKDFTDEKANKFDKIINGSFYNVPYPPYELTNNNAKIKNTKNRIAEIERLKAQVQQADQQPNNEYENELFEVVENTELMRLQLIFDGKPDEATRTVLKKNGFRWSPKNNCWQRQLTDNAKYSLKRIIKELK